VRESRRHFESYHHNPFARRTELSGSLLGRVLSFGPMAPLDGSNLKVTVIFTQRDFYLANVAIARKRRSWKSFLVWTIAFIAGASFLFHLTMARADPPMDWPTAVFMGAALALGLEAIFWPLGYGLIHGAAYYGARTLVRSKPAVLDPLTYTFSPSGVSSEGPTGSGKAAWAHYVCIRETSDQFLLYVQKRLAYPIPKRAFGSVADLNTFRQLVRQNFAGPTELAKDA